MLIYVDGIIVTGTHLEFINSLISRLQLEFPLKDLGPLSFFLGIQATRTEHDLHLCQVKYIADLLTRVHIIGAKAAKSPCSSSSKLSRYDGESLLDPTEYHHLFVFLQCCTVTRPEISFAVNQLCQHLHSPTSTHWTYAKRVLQYLKGIVDYGLLYTKGDLQLSAFCDSDWVGDPDDRHSTFGFAIFLGNSLVSWSAKKQAVISRSSTESEYRSLALTAATLFWLRMLFKELQVPLPSIPILWCDNVSALALASNPVFHARTKHIEVDYHFVRKKVLNRDISVKFISTIDKVADIFTKALSFTRFAHLTSKLMVIPPPISLQGAVRITDMDSDMAKDNAKPLSKDHHVSAQNSNADMNSNMAKDNAKPLSKDHVAAQNSNKDHDATQNSNVPIVITLSVWLYFILSSSASI